MTIILSRGHCLRPEYYIQHNHVFDLKANRLDGLVSKKPALESESEIKTM